MATTWDGTAMNELISGAALVDGATVTGLYSIDADFPAANPTRIMSNQKIIDNTTATGSPVLQCPTKQTFLSQF